MYAQGINYKALIKDGGGNVLASQMVTVQFQILQGGGMANVYQETHTPTTDANGIIIINIGEGTPDSGVFADIDWGSDTYFLNTQINTGGGLQDMGTTGFKTVPYAFHAKTAESVSGISGTTNFVPKSVDGVTLGNSQIFDDGTNVGIGTGTPTSKIDLRASGIGFSQQVDAVSPSVGFYTTTSSAWLQTNNDFPLKFTTNDGLTQMLLTTGGNLGIGTETPKALLSLSNVAANKKITLYDAADNDHEFLGFGISGGILRYQVEQGNNHVFYAATSSTTSDELLRIQADGKVGIGNNIPTAKLDVAGDIKIADGTQGAGKILTSDADGLASWQTPGTCGLSIGDTHQGGIIFYLDASGCHGLIAAPSDQSTGIRWFAGTYGNTQAKGDGIYAGKANTSIIIAAQVAIGDDNDNYAARLCNELQIIESGTTYGDWYLPSKYELNLMYENIGQGDALGLGNIGNFLNNFYCSSTEYDSFNVWLQIFTNGSQTDGIKNLTGGVRAVRAF